MYLKDVKKKISILCLKSTGDFFFYSQVVSGMDMLSWSKKIENDTKCLFYTLANRQHGTGIPKRRVTSKLTAVVIWASCLGAGRLQSVVKGDRTPAEPAWLWRRQTRELKETLSAKRPTTFRGEILEGWELYKKQTPETWLGVHLSIGLNTNLCV